MSAAQRLRKPLLIGVPVLLAVALVVFYLATGRVQSTDDAYVRAAQVTVSANVSGRVVEVPVHDNQHVHKGDVLFRLDQRPFLIAMDAANARLAAARLSIEALKATYRQRVADERLADSGALQRGQDRHRPKHDQWKASFRRSQFDRPALQ